MKQRVSPLGFFVLLVLNIFSTCWALLDAPFSPIREYTHKHLFIVIGAYAVIVIVEFLDFLVVIGGCLYFLRNWASKRWLIASRLRITAIASAIVLLLMTVLSLDAFARYDFIWSHALVEYDKFICQSKQCPQFPVVAEETTIGHLEITEPMFIKRILVFSVDLVDDKRINDHFNQNWLIIKQWKVARNYYYIVLSI